MKISRDRFEEILSSYLDGEATTEELELLAKCVRDDPRMFNIYYQACRVHAATCAMYGKKAVFTKLDGVELPNFARAPISRTRVALEWSAVVALMLLSATLMWVAIETAQYDFSGTKDDIAMTSTSQAKDSDALSTSVFEKTSLVCDTEISDRAVETSSVYSVIKIKVFAPYSLSE